MVFLCDTTGSGITWLLKRGVPKSLQSLDFPASWSCTIADLGEGNLADFLKPPSDAVQKDPRTVSVTSGHVYLLKQGHWKHDVLFRVEVSEPAPGNVSVDSSVNVPSVAATLSAKLASFGGRACRAHLHPHLYGRFCIRQQCDDDCVMQLFLGDQLRLGPA